MTKSFDGTEQAQGESLSHLLHRLDRYGISREIERLAWERDPDAYARRCWAQITRMAEG